MGGRGISIIAAALLSAALHHAPARALDCPVLDHAELNGRAAQLAPAARERFFEEMALERLAAADFIGVVAPISARAIAAPNGSTRSFIVRYEVQGRVRSPEGATIEILHSHWCDADCDSLDEDGLLQTAEFLGPRPSEVGRIPELARLQDRGRFLAATRIVRRPGDDRDGSAAILATLPAGFRFFIGDCTSHWISAQGHADIDRWIVNRLRWMLGVNDPAWAHWGPAPQTPPLE